jgi:hypothetical protein
VSRHARLCWATLAVGILVAPLAVGLTSSAGAATTYTVSGVVYRDIDNDGVRDAGEPGVAGIRVHRNSGAGTPTTTTDLDGRYSLSGLTTKSSGYVAVETGWFRSQCAQLACAPGPGPDNDFQTDNQFIHFPLSKVTQNLTDVNVGLLPDWPGSTSAAPAPVAGEVPANAVDVAARLSWVTSSCSDGKYFICRAGDTYTVSIQLHNQGTTAVTGLRAVLALPDGDRLATGSATRDLLLNAPATSPGISAMTASPMDGQSRLSMSFTGTLVPGGLVRVTGKLVVGGATGTPGCFRGHPVTACPTGEPFGAPLVVAITHVDQAGDPDSFGPGCDAETGVRQCPTGIHDKQVEPDEVDPVGHNVDATNGADATYDLSVHMERLTPVPSGGWHPGDPVTWRMSAFDLGPAPGRTGWTMTMLLPAGSAPAPPTSNALRTCVTGTTVDGYPFVRCTGKGPLSPGVASIAIDVVSKVPDAASPGSQLSVLGYVQPASADGPEANPLGAPPTSPSTNTGGTATNNDASATVTLP